MTGKSSNSASLLSSATYKPLAVLMVHLLLFQGNHWHSPFQKQLYNFGHYLKVKYQLPFRSVKEAI